MIDFYAVYLCIFVIYIIAFNRVLSLQILTLYVLVYQGLLGKNMLLSGYEGNEIAKDLISWIILQ